MKLKRFRSFSALVVGATALLVCHSAEAGSAAVGAGNESGVRRKTVDAGNILRHRSGVEFVVTTHENDKNGAVDYDIAVANGGAKLGQHRILARKDCHGAGDPKFCDLLGNGNPQLLMCFYGGTGRYLQYWEVYEWNGKAFKLMALPQYPDEESQGLDYIHPSKSGKSLEVAIEVTNNGDPNDIIAVANYRLVSKSDGKGGRVFSWKEEKREKAPAAKQ